MTANPMQRYAAGFAAGFVATLVFHQGILELLNGIGFTESSTFPGRPTAPLGVPAIWSLAFWGGVWGLIFVGVERWFPRAAGYWAAAIVFGALLPSLVAWFVVFPLKGMPAAGGFEISALGTGLVVNGAWGLGTGLFLMAFAGPRSSA